MSSKLSKLRVHRVSLVNRASVRDSDDETKPMTFLLAKAEGNPFEHFAKADEPTVRQLVAKIESESDPAQLDVAFMALAFAGDAPGEIGELAQREFLRLHEKVPVVGQETITPPLRAMHNFIAGASKAVTSQGAPLHVVSDDVSKGTTHLDRARIAAENTAWLMRRAEEEHRLDPSKSVAQHFHRVAFHSPDGRKAMALTRAPEGGSAT